MIAKIKQGKGFGGLVSYANDIKNKDTNIIASEGVDLLPTSRLSPVSIFKPRLARHSKRMSGIFL